MKKLHLSTKERKILGVCSGLSESIGISSDIIRIIFIISIFFGGAGFIAYILLYFILPTIELDDNIIDVEIQSDSGEKSDKKKLRRNLDNRFIAGICGGLAVYTGIDVSIFRICFVALSFAGGAGIFLYIGLWFIIPDFD